MTDFNKWLATFVEEKGLDLDFTFEVEGPGWGVNMIPLGCVVDFMKTTDAITKSKVKDTLVKIDFMNGDVMDFFNHCAAGLAK